MRSQNHKLIDKQYKEDGFYIAEVNKDVVNETAHGTAEEKYSTYVELLDKLCSPRDENHQAHFATTHTSHHAHAPAHKHRK